MAETSATVDEYLPWGDPAFIANPYPWLERLRREKPVHKLADGTYIVSKYVDVIKFARHPVMTVIDPPWVPPSAFSAALKETMLCKDGAEHAKVRARTNKWFTPNLSNRWAEAAVAVATATLDAYKEGEVIEGAREFGVMPAHAAMCAALQVPTDNYLPALAAMLDVMRGISSVATPDADATAASGFAYLRSRVLEYIEWKKANPGGGMADALIEAVKSGEINAEELVQTMYVFWGSGGHNPSYLIGSGLEYFAKHPEVYDIYRTEPEKRAAITNEIIRLFPAENSFVRYATEDVEIRGTVVPKDTPIRFLLNSANRDPDIFPNADELDVTRPRSAAHVSFGVGSHGCPGQMISRTVTDRIFALIAARVRRIEMAGEPTFDATDRARSYLTQPLKLFMS